MSGPARRSFVLTRREREVLIELCRPSIDPSASSEPASTKEIASALFVTEDAVRQHFHRLCDKAGIHEDEENRGRVLANYALESRLVTDADLGVPDRGSVAAPPSLDPGTPSGAREARQACARRAWREAVDAFQAAEANANGELTTPEDLAAFGEAALWAGEPQLSQDARRRAYEAYLSAGNERAAAVVALGLVVNCVVRLELEVAADWLGKAHRHLEPLPPGREHALLAAVRGIREVAAGEIDRAHESTIAAMTLGRAHGDRDAISLGQVFHACVLVHRGQLREARSLFDEAMATATAGELGPMATGLVYCRTIGACIDTFDFKRASEWTEVVEETRALLGEGGFPGDCRVHRATLLARRGEWAKAEEEARIASAESEVFDLSHVGIASYEIGELRLRAGDLDGAGAAFTRAAELGMIAEPGRSLVVFARGDAEAARRMLGDALAGASGDPLLRARLRPTEIDFALELGRVEEAKAALEDLRKIAREYSSVVLNAVATHAHGSILLAEERVEEAVVELRAGHRLFLELEQPYGAARARRDLGRALAKRPPVAAALVELKGAEEAFRRLGAVLDAAGAARLIASLSGSSSDLTSV